MSWLNVAGSIGSGISQGVQDLERMDRAKFEKEQQARQRKEWAEEDDLSKRLAGIKRTHEAYADPQFKSFPTRDDDGNVLPGVSQVDRPRSQVLAEEAAAYAGVSNPKLRAQGIQLDQHAYTASEQEREAAIRSKVDAVNARYAQARQLMRQDPTKFMEIYGQQFNDNAFGGADTHNHVVAMSSSPSGPVANVYARDAMHKGPMYQIPVAPNDLDHAIRAMHYAELESIDPKYAELALRNADVGIKRDHLGVENKKLVLEGKKTDSDSRYKDRVAGVHEAGQALAEKEFGAKLKGGMFTRPPSAADAFVPLGMSDDGTKVLGRQGSHLVESAMPPGYSKLFPKTTGERGQATKFLKNDDGTHTAYGADGKPLYNILTGGLEAPTGVGNQEWSRVQRDAKKAGVRAALGKDGSGLPTLAYEGKDGLFYSTLEEAVAAKKSRK